MAKLLFNPFTGTFDFVEKAEDKLRMGVFLLGTIDGVNTDFTTPEKFVFNPGVTEIAVYFNGQRFYQGVTGDFTVSESGGLGTGYDTIHMVVAPRPTGSTEDVLLADYVKR